MTPPSVELSGPLVYLNGRFLPPEEGHLQVNDAGFVFGATATDLCRTFQHRLFRLRDHLVRFRQSCGLAQIPQPLPDNDLADLAEWLVEHNGRRVPSDQDLALVLFATPGPIGYYAGQECGTEDGPPTLGMYTFRLRLGRFSRFFREGAHLVVPSTRHVPAECVDPRAKQRSRLHWWLAEREAQQTQPGAVALLLDAEGHVTETAGANFLVVREGTVITPPRRSILGGISLLVVEDLCGRLGIRFEERALGLEDCLSAEECLLSSTPYCVAGVSRINDVSLPWPGAVWLRLMQAWSDYVGVDIRGQIEKGDLLP